MNAPILSNIAFIGRNQPIGSDYYLRPNSEMSGHPTTGYWEKDKLYVDGDHAVWLCTEAGVPGEWELFAEPIKSSVGYIHNQDEPAEVWTIEHNLGRHPSVTVIDSTGNMIYGNVHYVDTDTITVTFLAQFSGKAILR
jgi:hypothetical protein